MCNFAQKYKNRFDMKRILLILMLFVAVAATAQTARPIRWRLAVKMTTETEGVATVKALVGEGWHLYGFEMPDGGPRPTTIDFEGSTDVKVTGPLKPSAEPLQVFDPMFETDVQWWAQTVSFTVPFCITGEAPELKVKIAYMGCDNTTCLPPKTETLVYKSFKK